MSLPNIPNIPNVPCIPPSAALSLILVSIAMEEIGLSHVINAEGEKIQSVVGALNCGKASVCDVLAVDKSVSELFRNVIKKEILLELKMVEALEALDKCEPCPPQHCNPQYNR
jgi:hypothetical protein